MTGSTDVILLLRLTCGQSEKIGDKRKVPVCNWTCMGAFSCLCFKQQTLRCQVDYQASLRLCQLGQSLNPIQQTLANLLEIAEAPAAAP